MSMKNLLKLFVVLVFCTLRWSALPAQADAEEPRPESVETPQEDLAIELAGPLAWHQRLEPALEEARQRKVPILVRVGAEWCGWCRRLDREIEKPEVQQELARWVLVELDADDDPDEVRRLRVGPIPALRILDAGARVTRSHDGFLAARPLLAWLRRADDPGAADESAVVEVPALTAESLPRMIKLLGHRNTEVRDEVIRVLSDNRELASPGVARAFRDGTLATRLSALEVLAQWKAPIADLDPWDPTTLTTTRLDEIDAWISKSTGQNP